MSPTLPPLAVAVTSYLFSSFSVAKCGCEINTWLSDCESGWLISCFFHTVFLELLRKACRHRALCCTADI